jgi:hypothetical protein
MGGDRVASGQNSLMTHAVRLSNAPPAWVLLWPRDLFLPKEFNPAKKYWVRVVAMLTKLVERFDPGQYRVVEGASGQTVPFEDEDEHEDEDEF